MCKVLCTASHGAEAGLGALASHWGTNTKMAGSKEQVSRPSWWDVGRPSWWDAAECVCAFPGETRAALTLTQSDTRS